VLFDWFTVFAQIANFLILMWLLKRFLYKPVLNAIDTREARIAKLLTDTEESQLQMQQQQEELTAKNVAFSKEREVLLAEAKADAERLKTQLNKTVSEEAEALRNQWIVTLQKEQAKLNDDINQRAHQAVFELARKTLQDLSNTELETHIILVFIKRLEQLSPQERQQFYASAHDEVVIRSSLELSEKSKEALRHAIATSLTPSLSIHFELDATLISGIEMTGRAHKLSWNIDDYLTNLKESVARIVNSTTQSHQKPKALGEYSVISE
jgi:F-type H+-transporting ATPase subunit b